MNLLENSHWFSNHLCMGGSRISRKGVHMYKEVWGFALLMLSHPTGAWIYENLLPCLMLMGLLFNSFKKFRENNSQLKKWKFWPNWFIEKACHFFCTRFEDFSKFLNSQTSDILKHITRFPRPKITQKSLQAPVSHPLKRNNLASLRPNYFIFLGYLKTGGRERGLMEPTEPPLDLPLLWKYFNCFHSWYQ